MNTITETRIPLAPSEIQCDWCCGTATSKIVDECAHQGFQYACTVHGTEWYPHLFPESDATPIEKIVEEAGVPTVLAEWELEIMRPIWEGVSLVKVADHDGDVPEMITAWRRCNAQTLRPWYPLVGHREGLGRNDLVTLASALFVECLERGAVQPAPSTVDPETGKVVGVWF
jgi:hypothetical protein